MTQHMPASIFSIIARQAKIAVFGHGQDITVFPEYAAQRDSPHCHSEYATKLVHLRHIVL